MVICAGLTYVTYRFARENLRLRTELDDARLTLVHGRDRAADLEADNERLSRQVRSQLEHLRRLRAENTISGTSARSRSSRAGVVRPI